MRRPVADPAASVRARLLAYAKSKGLAFELVLTRYALERLLDRLARSPYRERFVLKGGMLVTIWFDDPIRATRDLDLLGFGDPAPDQVRASFAEIMAMSADDPLAFDTVNLSVAPIREADQYGGIRLRTVATLANARIPIVVDVAFGDATEPGPLLIDYPVLLSTDTGNWSFRVLGAVSEAGVTRLKRLEGRAGAAARSLRARTSFV